MDKKNLELSFLVLVILTGSACAVQGEEWNRTYAGATTPQLPLLGRPQMEVLSLPGLHALTSGVFRARQDRCLGE